MDTVQSGWMVEFSPSPWHPFACGAEADAFNRWWTKVPMKNLRSHKEDVENKSFHQNENLY